MSGIISGDGIFIQIVIRIIFIQILTKVTLKGWLKNFFLFEKLAT